MMLATSKSFRAGADREVIRWDCEIARITALSSEEKLEMVLTPGVVSGQPTSLKKYLVNGVARRSIDFVGVLRAVLFWPEDLKL